MAAIFTQYNLSPFEYDAITTAVTKNTKLESGCIIWTGMCTSDGYGLLRKMFRGKRIKVKVHRLVYFLAAKHALSVGMHVSHLCHNKLCINIQHLSYEPQTINNNRLICKNAGECSLHYGYPRCQLQVCCIVQKCSLKFCHVYVDF